MSTRTRYPLQPLAQALGITLDQLGGHQPDNPPAGYTELAERLGITRQWVHHLSHHGLTDRSADRYAITTGHHPADIWDNWWDGADSDADWYTDDPTLAELQARAS